MDATPAAPATTHPEWARLFAAQGARGTIVLRDASTGHTHRHDPARAARPLIPASTFKVYNSLAALETGTVPDVDFLFEWDGVEREFGSWNRDHSLRTGIAASVVWLYQEVARRLGPEGYRAMFALEPFGNCDLRGGIDRFWLDGALRISAEDQVVFLDRLRRGDLAFTPENQAAVREVMRLREEPDFVLSGKTGWARVDPEFDGDTHWSGADLGWLVGWVETPHGAWTFALNLEADPASTAPFDMRTARSRVLYAVLAELGIHGAEA